MLVKGLCVLLVTLTSTALLVTACSRSKSSKISNLSRRVIPLGQPVPKGGGRYKVGSAYQINGRWYRPREDAGYDRVGIASWYGELFHGRYTANGEIYDMDALSAAHPTLPMPVHARVTNLENGRTIVVRVNDRGPYAHDRIIDLSRRSATLLGFKRQGTARVRVSYLKRAPINGNDSYERQVLASQSWARVADAKGAVTRRRNADPVTVASVTRVAAAGPVRRTVAHGLYFVQAASFREQDRADSVRWDLAALGPAAIYPAEVGGAIWYRVRLGPYDSKRAAERMRDRLKRAGKRNARVIEN